MAKNSAKKKNKKKQQKIRSRKIIANKAKEQEISLNDWNNPGNLYCDGLLIFDRLPRATSNENRCPNCNGCINSKEVQVYHPQRRKINRTIYECGCITKKMYPFTYRAFESADISVSCQKVTLQTLPQTMNVKDYNSLYFSRNEDGACAICHMLETKLAYILVGIKRKRKPILFCEHCKTIMQPHADFDEDLW